MMAETNKSHSPNVINVDIDSDSKTQTKNITLGDIADSIITKDYIVRQNAAAQAGQGPQFARYNATQGTKTPPNLIHNQDSIVTTDQWKYNRKMLQQHQQQQQQQHQQFQQMQQQQQQKQKEEIQIRNNSNAGRPPSGPSSDDGRHIIRMAQTPSPRSKSNFHEPVSPPETNAPHFYPSHPHMDHRSAQQQQQQQQGHPQMQHLQHNKAPQVPQQTSTFMMERYVKNRIVEAMRTEDVSGNEQSGSEKSQKEMQDRNASPGQMIIDEDRPKSSGGQQNASNTSKSSAKLDSQTHHLIYQTPTSRVSSQQPQQYYPFSALNVSAAVGPTGANPLPPPVQIKTSGPNDSNLGQNPAMDTQRPIMSDQYEALSDED